MESNKAQQHYYTNPSTTVNTTPPPSPSAPPLPSVPPLPSRSATPLATPSASATPSPSKPPLPPKPSLPPNESAGGSRRILFPPPVFSSVTSPLQPVRRKKGRPKKYGSPEQAMAVNPKPQQLSLGAGTSLSGSSEQPQPVGLGNAVQGFIPHVINVVAGEDVGQKIMMFIRQIKRELCILSASGTISNASLSRPATSGGNIAYEGRFDIVSLSGSCVRTETGGLSGGLSVCLSSADGQIIGGRVVGPLKAASPVQVIVATFMIDHNKDGNANAKGDASGSKLPSSVAGTSNVSFHSAFEAPGRNPIDASGSKLPSSVAGTSNVSFCSAFEAKGRNRIDTSGSKLPSSVAGTSNVSFRSAFEAPGRDLIDASGSKLPSSVAGTLVSNVGSLSAFEAPGRDLIDASGSKLPSSVAGSLVSDVSFRSAFEAPGRNQIDASGSKLPSSVAGTSNVSVRSAFEAPGRNTVDANDDHQSFGGNHFMMQSQGLHLASSPTDWRTALDDRTAFEFRGKTGHGSHHQSPESRDHD